MKYDVFVSYRRSSFESANLIAEKLRAMGYSVFFDVESLRSGRFNEQLFDVIDNCSDFVLVLPPNALDRCSSPDDWVRKEIIRAMQQGKNIVPVMLSGFSWPNPMPEGMEDLANYQAITAGETEFFDMSMKRLATYLHSKPHRDLRKFYKKLIGIFAVIMVVVGIAGAIVHHMSITVCRDVATSISNGMSVMNYVRKSEVRLYDAWTEFLRTNSLEIYKNDPKNRERFIEQIVGIENNLKPQVSSIGKPFEFTSFQKFVLGLYNITPQDVNLFYAVFDSEIQDITTQVANYSTISGYTHTLEEIADRQKLIFKMNEHQCNQMYYIYLDFLSKFPRSSVECHVESSPKWEMFPNNTNLHMGSEAYESLIGVEQKALAKLIEQLNMLTAETKGKVKMQEEQLNKNNK